MKRAVGIAVLSLLVAGPVFAQGASNYTPGHQMQEKGSYKNSPGASGYAPGQVMHRKGVRKGTTGASGYTPAYQRKHKKRPLADTPATERPPSGGLFTLQRS